MRKDNAFPLSVADGTEIYRGTVETCVDATAIVGQVYYYAAFASDDRNNWSAPAESAQWISEDVQPGSGIGQTADGETTAHKYLQNGCLFIQRNAGVYTVLGQKIH